ncbi:hypothetical protein M0813_08486 [Anaeramoeba flamelloides]|uniref:SARAH domain-containing protein n=1 Tax=Anaeramoeba flamelloides TaxID=1746091 RepID=A0ABQ8X8I0_9EUKA|nr:hypothetical protein M0813_08486 [Anaeramoeba flamelloides]
MSKEQVIKKEPLSDSFELSSEEEDLGSEELDLLSQVGEMLIENTKNSKLLQAHRFSQVDRNQVSQYDRMPKEDLERLLTLEDRKYKTSMEELTKQYEERKDLIQTALKKKEILKKNKNNKKTQTKN